MNSWLVVLIVLLVVSLINTTIYLLEDNNKLDEIVAARIIMGIFGWLLCLIGLIVRKVKELKNKKRREENKNGE